MYMSYGKVRLSIQVTGHFSLELRSILIFTFIGEICYVLPPIDTSFLRCLISGHAFKHYLVTFKVILHQHVPLWRNHWHWWQAVEVSRQLPFDVSYEPRLLSLQKYQLFLNGEQDQGTAISITLPRYNWTLVMTLINSVQHSWFSLQLNYVDLSDNTKDKTSCRLVYMSWCRNDALIPSS